MTKALYMMLADGLDMQLTGTAQCMTPSLSGRNNSWNFENAIGLVSPCFKQSSETCKEIRTKISPLYQNHKPYKMVYCSRNCLLITLQSPKIVFQTYIIHPRDVPNPLVPTFHHIGVGVLRIRTRHLETHWYLLPLNAFITYDILIYILHTSDIYSYNWVHSHIRYAAFPFITPESQFWRKYIYPSSVLRPQLIYDLSISVFR